MGRFAAIVRRYQSYDPTTRRFDVLRSNEQYAALLGTDASLLGRLYRGHMARPWTILRALVRTYPESFCEVFEFLRADDDEAVA